MSTEHTGMRRFLLALSLVLGLAGSVQAGPVVDIFRITTDNPGHGQFGGGDSHHRLGVEPIPNWYRGTVWFSNSSGDDLEHVQVKVSLFDRKQYITTNSKTYAIGTVSPGQIVSQDFKFVSGSDTWLVPVVQVLYEQHGVSGQQQTHPQDSY